MSKNYGRGKGFNHFIAEVTDIDSPYQDGSVRCRAYGTEDNTSAIPDDKLRWYKVGMSSEAGQVGGASSIHNLQKGSKVVCVYMDDDEQIPFVAWTLTSSGVANSPVDPDSIGIPKSARPKGDPRKLDGVAGEENVHLLNKKDKKIYKIAKDESGGKAAKKADKPTVGSKEYDGSKVPTDFIKKFDPKNAAGSVPFALDMVKKIKDGLNPQDFVKDLLGGKMTEMLGKLNEVMQKMQQGGGEQQMQQLTQLKDTLTNQITGDLSSAPPKPPTQDSTANTATLIDETKKILEKPKDIV